MMWFIFYNLVVVVVVVEAAAAAAAAVVVVVVDLCLAFSNKLRASTYCYYESTSYVYRE